MLAGIEVPVAQRGACLEPRNSMYRLPFGPINSLRAAITWEIAAPVAFIHVIFDANRQRATVNVREELGIDVEHSHGSSGCRPIFVSFDSR